MRRMPGGPRYVVVPYADRMDLAYAVADLVVCRAGASTVCELTAVGLPGGLRAAADRQRRAAPQRRPVVAAGGGLLVDDAELHAVVGRADACSTSCSTRTASTAMAAAAASVGDRDGDELLADLVDARRREAGR